MASRNKNAKYIFLQIFYYIVFKRKKIQMSKFLMFLVKKKIAYLIVQTI